MAKRRLSKLQKWILTEAYRAGRRYIKFFGTFEGYGLYKNEIYTKFFNVKLDHYKYGKYISSQLSNSIAVITSRSLKNLKEKGFIRLESRAIKLRKKDAIILTEKGIKVALMLIPTGKINDS